MLTLRHATIDLTPKMTPTETLNAGLDAKCGPDPAPSFDGGWSLTAVPPTLTLTLNLVVPDPDQVLTEATEPRIHAAALRSLLALVSATAAELPPALSPALLGNMRTWALVSMRGAADSTGGAEPAASKDLFHMQVQRRGTGDMICSRMQRH